MTLNPSLLPSHSDPASLRFIPARRSRRGSGAWLLYAALAGALTLTTVGLPASGALAAAQITAPVPPAVSPAAMPADDDAPANAEVLDTLIADGIEVTLTGQFLQTVDGDPKAPETVVALDLGQFVTIDPESADSRIASGDMIAATVKVPGAVVANLEADMRTELVDAADAGPLATSDAVTGKLLEAAADAAGPLQLEEESVLEPAAQAAGSTLPGPYVHTLHFVFMARDDRGVFWSREQLDAYVNGMAEFWIRESRGAVSFAYDWDDVIGVQGEGQCVDSPIEMQVPATEALIEAGKPTFSWTGNDTQHHLVILTPSDEETGSCRHSAEARAILHTDFSSPGVIHAVVGSTGSAAVFAHEMGHNFGLNHPGGLICPPGRFEGEVIGDEACDPHAPYAMNNIMVHILAFGYPLIAEQKAHEGVIVDGDGYLTIESPASSGVYTIHAASTPDTSVLHGLRIVDQDGSGQRSYWVDYFSARDDGIMITRSNAPPGVSASAPKQLFPAHLTQTRRTFFLPGDSFFSQSGRARVTVMSFDRDASTATIRVDMVDQHTGLNLSQEAWEPPGRGGSRLVYVDAAGEPWTASTSEPWLSATPTWSDGRTMTIAAGPLDGNERSGTVTVTAGSRSETIVVTQRPVPTDDCGGDISTTCVLVFDGEEANAVGAFEQGGDRDYWRFVPPSSGTWVISASGTGNADQILRDSTDIQLANASIGRPFARNLVAGQTYYVDLRDRATGEEIPPLGSYTLTVNPAEIDLSAETWNTSDFGGALSVTVTTNAGTFAATTSTEWLSVSPARGDRAVNGETVTVTAEASQGATRTGRVSFSVGGSVSKTLDVTQSPSAVTVSPAFWSAGHTAQIGTVTVAVATGQGGWSVATKPDWVQVTPSSGADGTIAVSVDTNAGAARLGDVVFTAGDGLGAKLTVAQGAAPVAISVTPDTWEPSWRGVSTPLTVSLNRGRWTVESKPAWVKVTPAASLSAGVSQVTITALANMGDPREGDVTFASGGERTSVTVRQEGLPDDCPVNMQSTTCAFQDDGEGAIAVGSLEWGGDRDYWRLVPPTSGTWVITSEGAGDFYGFLSSADNTLLAYDDDSAGNGQFRMTYPLTAGQVYYVQVRDHDWSNTSTDSVAYTLRARPASIDVSTQTWDTPEAAGTLNVTVTSTTGSFSTQASAAWLSVSPASGSAAIGGQSVTVSAQASPDVLRTGIVTFRAGTASTVLRVTQFRRGLAIVPASMSLDYTAETRMVDVVTDEVSWSVSQKPDWVDVTPSGGPRGTVAVSVTANAGAARQGEVVLTAGSNPVARLSVSQAAAPTAIGVTPEFWQPAAGGDTTVATVSLNHGSWTVWSSPWWVTTTPSEGPAGEVTLTAEPNVYQQAREGVVVFGSYGRTASLTLHQDELPDDCAEDMSTECEFEFDGEEGIAAGSLERGTDVDYWRFIPPTSGTWTIAREGMGEAYGHLLDSVGELAGSSVSLGEYSRFLLTGDLVAGQAYYVRTGNRNSTLQNTNTGTYRLVAQPARIGLSVESWNPTRTADTLDVLVTSTTGSFRAAAATWLTVSPSWSSAALNGLPVTVSATANTGAPRVGSVYFYSGTASVTLWVTQAGAPVTVTPTSWSPTYVAQTLTVEVVTDQPSWSVHQKPSWVDVTPSGGSGGSAAVSVTRNTGAAREGVVEFSVGDSLPTATLLVSQSAAPTSISVAPATWQAPATVSSTTATVSLNYGTWTVQSKPSWVTVSALSGSGGAEVTMSTMANSGEAREGEVIFASNGQTARFFVNQAMALTLMNVTPLWWEPPAAASSITATVSLNHGTWTVESAPSWVTVSPTSGVGGAQVTVSVTENTGFSRPGRVVFASNGSIIYMTIDQEEKYIPDDCAGDISTSCSFVFDGDEGTATGSLERGSDKDYWRFVPPTSGTWTVSIAGTGSAYGVMNDSSGGFMSSIGNDRLKLVNELTAGASYYVHILNFPSSDTNTDTGAYTLTARPARVDLSAGRWDVSHGEDTLGVTLTSTSGVFVARSPDWLAVQPRWDYAAIGSQTVNVSVYGNLGAARQGEVTFTGGGTQVLARLVVYQAAAPTSIHVTPSAWQAPAAASSMTATVSLNHGTWSVQSIPSWVTVSPASGVGDTEVTVSVAENTGFSRWDRVEFTSNGQTTYLAVTQAETYIPDDCAATTSTACVLEVDGDAGTASGSLERGSDHDYWRWVPSTSGTWAITSAGTGDVAGYLRGSGGEWLAFDDDAAGDGQFRLVYTVVAGQTYYVEIANHTSSDSNTVTGPYTLTAQPARIDISTQAWEPPYTASTLPVTVTSTTGAFTAGTSAGWLSVTPSSGSAAIGGQSVTVSVQANTGAGPRTGTVTFGAGSASIRLQVTQAGSGITISSTSWAPDHMAQTTTIEVVTGQATWSVTAKPDWVDVTPAGGTSGATTVTVAVAENTGAARVGAVVFSAGEDRPTATLYIGQAATPTVIRVTPEVWETGWVESSRTIEVSLNYGSWRVQSRPDWVGLSATGGTSGSISVLAAMNIFEAREGEVVFVSGGQTATLTIRQDRGPGPDDCAGDTSTACAIAFDGEVGMAAGSLERGDDYDYWRLEPPTSGMWSVVATGTGRLNMLLLDSNGDHVVSTGSPFGAPSYHVGGHLEEDETYYVQIRNWSSWIENTDTGPYALTVRPAEVTLSPGTWSPPATRSDLDVAVRSSTGRFAATVTASDSWLAVYPASGYPGAESQTVSVVTYPNTGPSRRGEVLFTGGGEEVLARLVVTQAGAPAAIAVTPRVWNPPGTGGGTDIQVHTDGAEWEVTGLPTWVTASPSQGTGDTAVRLNVSANNGSAGRVGTVTFSTYGGSTSVEVNQPIPSTLSLSRTSWSAPAKAGSTTTTVKTNQPEWTATTSAPWLSVSPSSGSSGAKATVSVVPNGIPGPVDGFVTFTAGGISRTMTVTQAAGTLTLSRTSWSPSASGASTTTKVTTVQPSWEATSDADWVTVSPVAGASGASITVTAAPNVGPARSASVRVVAASLQATMTVSQTGAPVPTVSLSRTSWSAGAGEGSTTSTVTTNGAGWSADADAAWLSVTPSSGATGDTLTVTAASNPGAARTGKITVLASNIAGTASRVLTVSQKGASVSVSRSSWSPAATGAVTTAEVTTDQPGWAAFSDQDWLTVVRATGVSGEQMVWAASVNLGAKRTATITVSAGEVARTVTVTQAAASTASVSLSRTSWAASSSLGSAPVEVTTNRGTWNAVTSEPWLTVSETSGVTGRIVVVTVAANSELWARTATVTVSAGGASKVLTVTQAAGPRWIDMSHTSWMAPGGGGTVDLFALTTSGGTWTASESASWLSLSTTSARMSGGFVTISAAANTTTSRRQATVTVKSGTQSTTVTVVQDSARTLTLSKTTWAPAKGGGSTEVSVEPYNQGTWSATSDQPWLVVAGPLNPSDDGLTLLAQPNTGPARTGTVTVRSGDQTGTLTVTQRAG